MVLPHLTTWLCSNFLEELSARQETMSGMDGAQILILRWLVDRRIDLGEGYVKGRKLEWGDCQRNPDIIGTGGCANRETYGAEMMNSPVVRRGLVTWLNIVFRSGSIPARKVVTWDLDAAARAR